MNVMDETQDSTQRAQRKRKDLAAQKRAKIIAQMTQLQKNFIEQNLQLCSDTMDESATPACEPSSPGTHSQASPMISSSDQQILSTSPKSPTIFEPMITDESYPMIPSCLGSYDMELVQAKKQTLTCIFCQESSEVKLNSDALVLSAYVQK